MTTDDGPKGSDSQHRLSDQISANTADPPLGKTTKGFCEDAWSNFRKPGRDLVPLRQPCRPFIASIGVHRKFTGSRYIAFPMNLAMSLLIGILSIATATMWFVALALWLRSSAGRSVAGNFPVTGGGESITRRHNRERSPRLPS